MTRSLIALLALNFFMSDVRDGLGPFLGVLLQAQGFPPAEIGVVMTLGGLLGVVASIPLGALIDASRAKRMVLAIATVGVTIACGAIFLAPYFGVVVAAQTVAGVAGAAFAPAIAGLTLGLVGQRGYAEQLGRNEAANHAGNMVAALAAGGLSYLFGLPAVLALMAGLAVMGLLALAAIDPADIDHAAARGLAEGQPEGEKASLGTLLARPALLVLAVTMALFHLANASMLPLLGQAMVARGAGDPGAYTAATVVIAQASMIPVALLAARWSEKVGFGPVMLVGLAALPIRGLIAGLSADPWILVPVQILDGVGAGTLGVAMPGMVARLTRGTGHTNAALGAILAIQGVGGALSAALGGTVAQYMGYGAAFLVLGAIALVAVLLWLLAERFLEGARGGVPA
ncbi:MFS transporter [Acetobacteraceae bacterium H6797]|nr:MFS transporter [Acetobacteraceae bacterium H6797]